MRFIFLLAVALLLPACSAAGEPSETPRQAYDILLGLGDAGEPVRLRSGQRVGIRLADNPSIGNLWSVADVPANLRSDGFLYDDRGSRAQGAGTVKIFSFVGTAAGEGTLRLVLAYRGVRQRELKYRVITH